MRFDTMIDLEPRITRIPRSDPRRRFQRVQTCIPVRLAFLGQHGESQSHGHATLADLSVGGLRLASVQLQERGFPLNATSMIVTLRQGCLRGLWIKAKPIHARFEISGVEVGAEIER